MSIKDELNRKRCAEIAGLCADAGVMHLAADYMKRGTSAAEVRGNLDRLGGIRQAVAEAGARDRAIDPALAEQLWAEGLSVSEASERLAALVGGTSGALRRSPQGAAAAATADCGWDAICARLNAERGAAGGDPDRNWGAAARETTQ